MDNKQKTLLIGGGIVALGAILLWSGKSKAATAPVVAPPTNANKPTLPGLPPDVIGSAPYVVQQPSTTPTTPTTLSDISRKPQTPAPMQGPPANVAPKLIDSPFGQFEACSDGAAMVEPYHSNILSGIDASFDLKALRDAASVYHAAGCQDLAEWAAQRAEGLDTGGQTVQTDASGQQFVYQGRGVGNLPGYGSVPSACDAAGVMVDGQRGADIAKWIDSLTDADKARAAMIALANAQPPCSDLANRAAVRASVLDAQNASAAKTASSDTGTAVKNADGTITIYPPAGQVV
jgi:hypothetical protein